MARDTAAISSDVVIGSNTPDVETTVEALIRAYNRLPLDSNLTAGDRMEWDGTDWIPAGSGSSGVDQLYFSAPSMASGFGSPTLGSVNGWPAWLMDPDAAEIASGTVDLPTDWTTFDIKLVWANAGSGSGDVVWRWDPDQASDGDSLDNTSGATQTVTAAGIGVLKVTTFETGVSRTGAFIRLKAVRLGGDAADTLGNDAGVIGFLLSKAS